MLRITLRCLTTFLLIALLAVPVFSQEEESSGREQYYRGVALGREGKFDEANQVLRKLAEQAPEGRFADDALYEMGRIADEEKTDYEAAVRFYKEFQSRFPSSRLVRRIGMRLDYLKQGLGAGAEPLALYETARTHTEKLGKEKAKAQIERVLEEFPTFPYRFDAQIWLANYYRRAGEYAEAVEVFEEIARENPGTDKERRGKLGEAEALMELGSVAEATKILRSLAASEGYGLQTAQTYLKQLGEAGQQQTFFWVALLFLIVMIPLSFIGIRRSAQTPLSAWPPPVEFWPLLAVVIAFIAATLFLGGPSGRAMFPLILTANVATLVLVWLNGVFLRSATFTGRGKLIYWLLAGLMVLATAYVIYYSFDMLNQVIYDLTYKFR